MPPMRFSFILIYALRVFPAVTRLTVYRRLRVKRTLGDFEGRFFHVCNILNIQNIWDSFLILVFSILMWIDRRRAPYDSFLIVRGNVQNFTSGVKNFLNSVTSLTKCVIWCGLRQLVTADTPWCNRAGSEN